MRRLSKGERVKFEGRDLPLNTVKSYASNKKHPLHTKAKVFLEKKHKNKKASATRVAYLHYRKVASRSRGF